MTGERSTAKVLIPSRAESFGLVLLEAWAEASPALFSAASGLQAVARACDGVEALVDPNTTDLWAARIHQALRDPQFLQRQSCLGPQRVAQRYSWRNVAQQVSRAYRSVTLGPPPP